ncbi:MAG: alkaline phosphatase family protein [Steroidobacteraceae bacterium]
MQKFAPLLTALLVTGYATPAPAGKTPRTAAVKTQNVVLIVSDGLRWQEVFQGADPLLLDTKNGGSWVEDAELKRRYWRDTAQERRELLMPFIWGTVARQGQLFGNRPLGSDAHVTNGAAFSYPGYNEMSVGFPNPDITSNEFGPNPNVSVFEWLNKSPDLTGRVAIYGTWHNYVDIFNEPRSQLVMQAGWTAPPRTADAAKDALLGRLFDTTTRFDEDDVGNSFLQVELLDYVQAAKPRVLFVGYGETDNWAHQGRYDLVLESAHRTDGFVKELWDTMQTMPQYRGSTTFIITADHGRGSGPVEWKDHGVREKGSENVWIAVIGPDTPPLGERANVASVTQAQIAATVAALMGKDYRKDVPRAAPGIADVLKGP